MTDQDACCLLNAQAESVAQGRDLHCDHHIGLSFDAKVARNDSQELPGPVLCTKHASGGNAQVEVLLPSDPNRGIRPEQSIFDILKALCVHHRG